MNPKLAGWIELMVAAAFTGALNASGNMLAAPDIFAHGHVASILLRMAAVGAILSMRDQIKQSPVPVLFTGYTPPALPAPAQGQVSLNLTATANAAQEELHVNSSGGNSASK